MSVELDPHPRSVREARGFVRRGLGAMATAADPQCIEAVVLLVSELITNALVHGYGRPQLVLRINHDCAHVEVFDLGRGTPATRPVDVGRPGGRGLRIVDSLATEWGVQEIAGDGKRVWFDAPLRTAS